MDHWAYSGMAVAREINMAAGGYVNDYRLDDDIPTRWAVQSRLNRLMALVNERTGHRDDSQAPVPEISLNSDNITVGRLLLAAAKCASIGDPEWALALAAASQDSSGLKRFSDADEAGDYLIARGVLTAGNLAWFRDPGATATMGQLMSIIGALYTALMEDS